MTTKYVTADEYDRIVTLMQERRELTARLARMKAKGSNKSLADRIAELRPLQARIAEIDADI